MPATLSRTPDYRRHPPRELVDPEAGTMLRDCGILRFMPQSRAFKPFCRPHTPIFASSMFVVELRKSAPLRYECVFLLLSSKSLSNVLLQGFLASPTTHDSLAVWVSHLSSIHPRSFCIRPTPYHRAWAGPSLAENIDMPSTPATPKSSPEAGCLAGLYDAAPSAVFEPCRRLQPQQPDAQTTPLPRPARLRTITSPP
uniref:PH domain-containing protein n=1 Tax=Mycena chlorophos TaxID=658473 RepID=A0ABQ0L6K7_MYCCL|nr:predicted protein [Mycena chlorophos]